MELVLDEAGHVKLQEGKILVRHPDGKELPFDISGTAATISRLNGEAKTHREAKERAEAGLKAFEGIEDAAAARKAMEIVANLDAKKLVDAGEVQKVRDEAVKAYEDKLKAQEEKYKPVIKERDGLRNELSAERIGGAFKGSKFIEDKLAVPKDMIQATFGQSFKDEGGAVVGYGKDGKAIYSRVRPGEVADFDEALEIMVDAYPFKDHILKGSGASGGGAGGGGRGGASTITRAQLSEWQASNPAKAAAEMARVREGKATLVE
jgi:hypothetical protein